LPENVVVVHEKIINGASIGQAFNDAGIWFGRYEYSIETIKIPFVLKFEYPTQNELRQIRLVACVGIDKIPYAFIEEYYPTREKIGMKSKILKEMNPNAN